MVFHSLFKNRPNRRAAQTRTARQYQADVLEQRLLLTNPAVPQIVWAFADASAGFAEMGEDAAQAETVVRMSVPGHPDEIGELDGDMLHPLATFMLPEVVPPNGSIEVTFTGVTTIYDGSEEGTEYDSDPVTVTANGPTLLPVEINGFIVGQGWASGSVPLNEINGQLSLMMQHSSLNGGNWHEVGDPGTEVLGEFDYPIVETPVGETVLFATRHELEGVEVWGTIHEWVSDGVGEPEGGGEESSTEGGSGESESTSPLATEENGSTGTTQNNSENDEIEESNDAIDDLMASFGDSEDDYVSVEDETEEDYSDFFLV